MWSKMMQLLRDRRKLFGVKHEMYNVDGRVKHRCVPFEIRKGANCKDVFQGDTTLIGIQFLDSRRCAEDTARSWNEFHKVMHMYYDERIEKYKGCLNHRLAAYKRK